MSERLLRANMDLFERLAFMTFRDSRVLEE
jgi:hypothetical protein